MPSDDFASRRRTKELLASAVRGAAPAVYRAGLTKARSRSRLYRIDQVPGGWRCEVWHGATIHRTHIAETQTEMVEHQRQYAREVADLILDGWTLDV